MAQRCSLTIPTAMILFNVRQVDVGPHFPDRIPFDLSCRQGG